MNNDVEDLTKMRHSTGYCPAGLREGERVPKKAVAYVIYPGAALIIAVLAGRVFVPVDGWFYLQSAEGLFTANFRTSYHWVREPGYPITLSFLTRISSDLRVVAIFQHVVFGFAVGHSVRILSLRKVWQFLGIIPLLSPLHLGFSGSVLQQSLMMSFLLILATEAYNAILRQTTWRLIVFASMGPILSMFLILPVCLTILFVQMRINRPSHTFKSFLKLALLPLASLINFLLWTAYKGSIWGFGRVRDAGGYLVWPWHYSPDGYGVDTSPLQVLGSLLGIRGDTHVTEFSREISVFGYGVGDEACGLYHPVPISAVDQGRLMDATTCIPQASAQVMEAMSDIAIYINISLLILALAIVLVRLALRRADIRDIALTPAFALLPSYIAISAGISRYSYPVSGVALIYLASILSKPNPHLVDA